MFPPKVEESPDRSPDNPSYESMLLGMSDSELVTLIRRPEVFEVIINAISNSAHIGRIDLESLVSPRSPLSGQSTVHVDGRHIPSSVVCCIISFLHAYERLAIISTLNSEFNSVAKNPLSHRALNTNIDADCEYLRHTLPHVASNQVSAGQHRKLHLTHLVLDKELILGTSINAALQESHKQYFCSGDCESVDDFDADKALSIFCGSIIEHELRSLSLSSWNSVVLEGFQTRISRVTNLHLSKILLPDINHLLAFLSGLTNPKSVTLEELTIANQKSDMTRNVSTSMESSMEDLRLYLRPSQGIIDVLRCLGSMSNLQRVQLRYFNSPVLANEALAILSQSTGLRILEIDVVPPTFWQSSLAQKLSELVVMSAAHPPTTFALPTFANLRTCKIRLHANDASTVFKFVESFKAPGVVNLKISWSIQLGLGAVPAMAKLRVNHAQLNKFLVSPYGLEGCACLVEDLKGSCLTPMSSRTASRPGSVGGLADQVAREVPRTFLKEFAGLLSCRCSQCRDRQKADHAAALALESWKCLDEDVREFYRVGVWTDRTQVL